MGRSHVKWVSEMMLFVVAASAALLLLVLLVPVVALVGAVLGFMTAAHLV